MAENNAYDEGFYIIGSEYNGRVHLTKKGRRILGVGKRVVKATKILDHVMKTKDYQK